MDISMNGSGWQTFGSLGYQRVSSVRLSDGTSLVTAIATSADGALASGHDDGRVRIWDLRTGSPGIVLGETGSRVVALLARSGGQLISSHRDGAINVWDPSVSTVRPVGSFQFPSLSQCLALPDGRIVLGNFDGELFMWDADPSRAAERFGEHEASIHSLVIAGPGDVASVCEYGVVRIWQLRDLSETRTLDLGHDPTGLAYLDHARLASSARDGRLFLWDLQQPHPEPEILTFASGITSLASEQNSALVLGFEDGSVARIDPASGSVRGGKAHSVEVSKLALFPGCRVVSANREFLRIWEDVDFVSNDAGTRASSAVKALLRTSRGIICGRDDATIEHRAGENIELPHVAPTRVASYGTGLIGLTGAVESELVAAYRGGEVIAWGKAGRRNLSVPIERHDIRSIARTTDGTLCIGTYHSGIWGLPCASDMPATRLISRGGEVTCLCAMPDGRLAAGYYDGYMRIWDTRTPGDPHEQCCGAGPIWAIACNSEGALAVGGADGHIAIFQGGQLDHTMPGHTGDVTALAWIGRKRLVSGSRDHFLRLWTLGFVDARLHDIDAAVRAVLPIDADHIVAGDVLGRLHWLRLPGKPAPE